MTHVTTPLASIIIPIASDHAFLVSRAIYSANRQTVPCTVIPVVDEQRRGAGWARNRGLEQAQTDYVVFLDADDELAPTFVERTYERAQQTGRYVYTDFLDDTGNTHAPPDCAWTGGNWHAVTTLLPTAWALAVNGFDEALSGGEDSEFYINLTTSGFCGIALHEPLLTYHDLPDARSKRWRNSPAFDVYRQLIQERYTDKGKTAMGCCQDPAPDRPQLDRAAPGLVLARPRWTGNRQERGVATGVLYPRADASKVIQIDPRDLKARPDLWEAVTPRPVMPVVPPRAPMVIQPPAPDVPTANGFAELTRQVLGGRPEPVPPPPAPLVSATPDFSKLLRATKVHPSFAPEIPTTRTASVASVQVMHSTSDPVFVFPDKDYPSYADVRRLVELSGFEARKPSEFNINEWEDPNRTFIVLAPGQPYEVLNPDIDTNLTRARPIWWSLEYGGEYEPDLPNWRGEVWACDPMWAKTHGAKLVVMGSHAKLGNTSEWLQKRYDVTMLGYMTPRREIVKHQLSDLQWDAEIYPGYGDARDVQLLASRLMLSVHQRDDTPAIAPQRIALAAAYKLPLVCEAVPDAGEYERYIPFVAYEHLNAEVRSQLAMMETGMPQERAERLYRWLCEEHTFRHCVEEALKS